MAGFDDTRQALTGNDWARGLERRILHEERRPAIRAPSDLLGPGIAPFAIQLYDWNQDEAVFNGFWWTEPGALNTPDPDTLNYYMGQTIGSPFGFGLQHVTQYRELDGEAPNTWDPNSFVRRFYTQTGGAHRSYSNWRLVFGVAP